MRRIAKLISFFLTVLVVTPIVAFVAYDLALFQPHVPEITSFVQRAAQDERTPSPLVSQVVRAGVTQHLSAAVSRLVLSKLNLPSPKTQMGWHVTGALWWALVALHFSEQEQTTLFLSLSYMGDNTTGFAAASQSLFGKQLNSLSLEEIATLAVISKGPSAFLESPERLARVRAAVVSRVQDGR